MVHGVKPSAAHAGHVLGAQDHGLELKWSCTLREFGNASFHPGASLESQVGGWGSHLSCMSLIFGVQVTACLFGLKLSLLVTGSYCTTRVCPVSV